MSDTSASRQLGLPLTLRDDATFATFEAGDPANALVLAALQQALTDAGPRLLLLHGGAGCGRSHLLQAMCHAALARQQPCLYLPLAELQAQPAAELLAGLDSLALVCLDDVDAVLGRPDWEEALFHTMNRLRDAGRLLVLAAAAPPAQLPIRLADLQSRLAAAAVFRLQALDDAGQFRLLQRRARACGLLLDDDATHYLQTRAPRDTTALLQLLARLDEAALIHQRRLTIPFIKTVMGW